MKTHKKVVACIIAAIMLFAQSLPVYATAVYNPTLLGSDVTDSVTAAKGLGIITDGIVLGDSITRKDVCKLLVRFYKVSTGASGLTLKESPFVDDNTNEVTFCFENGIIEGINEYMFLPEGYVTRQEACSIIVNMIKYAGVNVIYPDANNITPYKDRGNISEEYIADVDFLSNVGVIQGFNNNFYPTSYITYEQLATMLVDTYNNLMLSKVIIREKSVSIGDYQESIISKFGTPGYTISDGNATLLVYNSDMKDFFYFGISDGKVVEIFSNGTTFEYRGIKSGSNADETNFGYRADVGENATVYTDGQGVAQIGWFNSKISYIRIVSKNSALIYKMSSTTIYNDKVLLLDIINAERIKNGYSALTINSQVANIASQYARSMTISRNYSYYNVEGEGPFERLSKNRVNYIMASENIAISETPAEAFIEWMNKAGSRVNIMSDYMDTIGIGMSDNGNNGGVYIVMDFVKLGN